MSVAEREVMTRLARSSPRLAMAAVENELAAILRPRTRTGCAACCSASRSVLGVAAETLKFVEFENVDHAEVTRGGLNGASLAVPQGVDASFDASGNTFP